MNQVLRRAYLQSVLAALAPRLQDDDGYIGMFNYAGGIEIYDGANPYYNTFGEIDNGGFFPLSPGFCTIRLERAPNSATVAFKIDGGTNGSIDVDATLTSFWDWPALRFIGEIRILPARGL